MPIYKPSRCERICCCIICWTIWCPCNVVTECDECCKRRAEQNKKEQEAPPEPAPQGYQNPQEVNDMI